MIGGRRGAETFFSCERFDAKSKRWSFIASMNYRRACAAAAYWQNTIIVFGGQGKPGGAIHAIEQYDVATDKWSRIEERMDIPRSGHSAVVWDELILIVGGSDLLGPLPNSCFDASCLRFVDYQVCETKQQVLPHYSRLLLCCMPAGSSLFPPDNATEILTTNKRRRQ